VKALVARLPTRTNSTVEVHRGRDGLVVVKSAGAENTVGSGAADLASQVRHMRAVAAIAGDACPFPPILHDEPGRYVMPFVAGPTLAELFVHAPDRFDHAVGEAVDLLLSTADLVPAVPARDGFLCSLIDRRLRRLEDQLRIRPAAARRFDARAPALAAARREASRMASDGTLAAAAGVLGPTSLSLASHSDFVPENVIRGPDGPTFVDPRPDVVWCDGLPRWDPVLDLASFVAFHRDVPTLSGAVGDRAAVVASLHDRFAASGRPAADPGWRERLDLYVWVRLLGYLSIRLAYVAEDAPELLALATTIDDGWTRARETILDAARRQRSA
jgi:hypothetical protein